MAAAESDYSCRKTIAFDFGRSGRKWGLMVLVSTLLAKQRLNGERVPGRTASLLKLTSLLQVISHLYWKAASAANIISSQILLDVKLSGNFRCLYTGDIVDSGLLVDLLSNSQTILVCVS